MRRRGWVTVAILGAAGAVLGVWAGGSALSQSSEPTSDQLECTQRYPDNDMVADMSQFVVWTNESLSSESRDAVGKFLRRSATRNLEKVPESGFSKVSESPASGDQPAQVAYAYERDGVRLAYAEALNHGDGWQVEDLAVCQGLLNEFQN